MAKLIEKFKTGGPPTGSYYGTITEDKDIVYSDPASIPVLTSTTDYKKSALQNSEHDNWRDAYAEYSGRNGSRKDRKEFRKAWKNGENVRARVGEDTYNQLRATAEQEQFGNLGYNPNGDNTFTREERRFDRRFNRQLRNGKFDSNLTKSQPTSSASPTNDYSFQRPLLFNMTTPVFKTAYSFGSYNPPTDPTDPTDPTGAGAGAGAGGSELKPKTYWNAIAAEKLGEGKTMQDVIALQQRLGITADGKWGKLTQAAYDAYLQRIQNEHLMGPTPDFVSPGTYFDVNGPSRLMKHSAYGNLGYTPTSSATPVTLTQALFNFDNFVREQNLPGDNIISKDGHRYVRFDPRGSGDFYVGDDGNIYSAGMFGILGNITDGNEMMNIDGTNTYVHGKKYRDNYNYLYNLINPVSKQKQGGKMNRIKYFQQGGQMQQQDPKQQIIQLVQAAMQGDQKATETINKVMEAAKAGDQQAVQLAQMIQQIVEQMQGQATMAKWGSKLRYIRSLKYAKGGKTCPSCQNGGVPANTPSKKINKKVEEKACGGKAKKKYFGGYIN